MGLSAAMSSAISGLRINQAALELVSNNIANVNTPGYSRKTIVQVDLSANGSMFGVRQTGVERSVTAFLQNQLRTELGISGELGVLNQFLDRLDWAFGQPGSDAALDTALNRFTGALQELSTSPESDIARDGVIFQADMLVSRLHNLTQEVQSLRQEAEFGISDTVNEMNGILQEIATLNQHVMSNNDAFSGSVDFKDRRDALVNRLSEMIDIRVAEGEHGTIRIYAKSGGALVDGQAVQLNFDGYGNIGPQSVYSTDENERTVGTIKINGANGYELDMLADQSDLGGILGGYINLRDNILVEAQAQLDELAHGLALSLSDRTEPGAAITAGAQEGFDLDVGGLLSGNVITLSYNESGIEKKVSFVRVDDPSTLPLDDSVTPDPDDTVIGIDFSGGMAAVAAQMDAALGGGVTVSSPAGTTLRFLDDGAVGTTDISSASARITTSALLGEGVQLSLFQDIGGTSYSGSLDGVDQKIGFAARISLNSAVRDNTDWLVNSTGLPDAGSSDPARPLEMLARLTEYEFTFSPDSGLGTSGGPFSGTIDSFTRRVVSTQTGQSQLVRQNLASQAIVIGSIQQRVAEESGVNIDEEMAMLLELQNAYATNARVISAIKEMIEMMLNV